MTRKLDLTPAGADNNGPLVDEVDTRNIGVFVEPFVLSGAQVNSFLDGVPVYPIVQVCDGQQPARW